MTESVDILTRELLQRAQLHAQRVAAEAQAAQGEISPSEPEPARAPHRPAPPAPGELCSLADALAWEFDDPAWRFLDSFELEIDEARDILRETKRWTWLLAKMRRDRPEDAARLGMLNALQIVDHMWHTFIVFTREYSEYCQTYLGGYIHHAPTPHAEKLGRSVVQPEFVREYSETVRHVVGWVTEELGSEVARKWFHDYPNRYDQDFILERHFVIWY